MTMLKILKKHWLIVFFGFLLMIFVLTFFNEVFLKSWDLTTPSAEVTIERGMTPTEIGDTLLQHGVILNPNLFLLSVKVAGVSRRLKAGHYVFSGRMNHFRILHMLTRGQVVSLQLTFPEGIRAGGIASLLQRTLSIDSTTFMHRVTDSTLCRSHDVSVNSLEGYLYPDTYAFQYDASPDDIIHRMTERFFQLYNDTLMKRTEYLGRTVHEIVTLASIVEGEAVIDSERPIIAALYWNRLRRNMLLQSDPTIQYLIRGAPRRLLNKDLEIDSPYNTYLYPGLPPGPVNNPGRASIRAVLYPDSTDVLFMVANGDGSHTFSRNMRDHLKAKARFDQIRRQNRRRRQ